MADVRNRLYEDVGRLASSGREIKQGNNLKAKRTASRSHSVA